MPDEDAARDSAVSPSEPARVPDVGLASADLAMAEPARREPELPPSPDRAEPGPADSEPKQAAAPEPSPPARPETAAGTVGLRETAATPRGAVQPDRPGVTAQGAARSFPPGATSTSIQAGGQGPSETPGAMSAPRRASAGEQGPLLEVVDLVKHFPIRKGLFARAVGAVRAVDGVSFTVRRGETLGLVGESGCGKTTVGRCLLRLIEPTSGRITLTTSGGTASLLDLKPREMQRLRPRMQMVFQDPQASLNSRMTVGDIIAEPLVVNRSCGGPEREERVVTLLEAVGLRSQDRRRYPHAFSGGQRQRIGIARALALRPDLIVADEPVSALDVSVQAQVLNLMADLREQFGLSYIFISHGLGVVEHISDRVAVMYLGKIVELGVTRELFTMPRHPYTEALLSAVPVADPRAQRQRERIRLQGDVPSPANPPSGCRFHTRCRYAQPICSQEEPPLREITPGAHAACHFAEQLELQGV